MRKARRLALLAFAVLLAAATPPAWGAKDKEGAKDKDKKAAAGGAKNLPPGVSLNACGCYKNTQGACVCTDRKAKCECPGECEPVGCEEKRQKDLEKEYEAEVKRAQDEEKKRKAAEEAAEAGGGEAAGAEGDKAADKGGGGEAADESGGADAPAAPASKSTSRSRKATGKAGRSDKDAKK